jgi:hypothetical protein
MSKKQIGAVTTGVLSLALGVFGVKLFWFSADAVGGIDEPHPSPPVGSFELTSVGESISGPYIHKNLTVYLIHGKDQLTGKMPITLEEALERRTMTVHETGDVNELQVENTSDKEEVYIQAGDIVKGGRQDRVLAVDLVVPARSGKMPIDSFCVESGRWSRRGNEPNARFDSSTETIATKDLKLAAKQSKNQSQVWEHVEQAKEKLTASTNTNVASNASQSSLPLALENQQVVSSAAEYKKALSDIVKGKPDVIGFVFAINGEINSADVYGSSALFLKLWPRLLKATAVEAVAESHREDTKRIVSAEEMRTFLSETASAKVAEQRAVTDRITMVTRETENTVLIESHDRGVMLHGNFLKL